MDELYVALIQTTEQVKATMEAMRLMKDAEGALKYDGRSLSIALTHLEIAQLWITNAIP